MGCSPSTTYWALRLYFDDFSHRVCDAKTQLIGCVDHIQAQIIGGAYMRIIICNCLVIGAVLVVANRKLSEVVLCICLDDPICNQFYYSLQ